MDTFSIEIQTFTTLWESNLLSTLINKSCLQILMTIHDQFYFYTPSRGSNPTISKRNIKLHIDYH